MIMEHFQELTAPRIAWAKRHNLPDIVALTFGAALCGADSGVGIAEFGPAKAEGLRRFLALPNRIPAHDTRGRVFRRRDPAQFQAGFLDWVWSASRMTRRGSGGLCPGSELGPRPSRGIADREELAYIDPAGEWPTLSSVARISSAGRQLALNRLRQESRRKVGIQAKREKAGWDHDCLPKIPAG